MPPFFALRPYQARDLADIYTICLQTGDSGEDATHLYRGPEGDPDALGHIYAGPYVTLEPDLAFVLEDEAGVCGYILGAFDTPTFHARYVSEWLPPLQARLPEPQGAPESWTRTQILYHRLHHPTLHFPPALHPYPSHLHIDLLPRAQERGNGAQLMRRLLRTLAERGSPGVHLGLGIQNRRAFHFYQKLGFRVLEDDSREDAIYMGQPL